MHVRSNFCFYPLHDLGYSKTPILGSWYSPTWILLLLLLQVTAVCFVVTTVRLD